MPEEPAAATLLHSPLHERHVGLGAKLAEFGGWAMPLEYPTGVVAEHTAVREAVGLFDVSHLGKAEVAGPGAAAYVNATLTNDLGRIGPGRAQYTLCCDEATGGVVDDLIAYYRDDDHVFLIPNAANTAEVVRRLAAQAPDGVTVTDRHTDFVVLAVQGPAAAEVVAGVGLPVDHDYMSFVEGPAPDSVGEADIIVCRTGYTGEQGYEIVAPYAVAEPLWDALVAAGEPHGLVPAGLGARDTLRTEMGYPLHGQDLGPDVTPNQGRVGWAVGWDKEAFWGREVLRAERAAGPRRRLVGLRAEGRGIPRPHMAVSHAASEGADAVVLGEVTSGTFSPTLRTGVGLALLAVPEAGPLKPGDRVAVDVRGRREPFTVTALPFVDTSVRG